MAQITRELAKQILKDRTAGLSYRQITIKHGIAKGSAQSIVWRFERGGNVGGGFARPKPWTPPEIDALRSLADQGISVSRMAQLLHRSEERIRPMLRELLGKPYVSRPSEALAEERRAYLAKCKSEAIARRPNDHLAHCLAVIRANNGCGYPAYEIPPTYRVAA
jgi:hypothetical protein